VFVIMSDDFQNDENETVDASGLRKQLSELGKKLKAAEEQNAQLAKQVRSNSVKELFAAAKADPRGVKFYNGEPTKEALTEWLKGDGEVFAKAPETNEQQGQGQEGQAGAPEAQGQFPPGFTAEMVQAAQAAARMQPTPANLDSLADLADRVGKSSMKTDDDKADLQKLWDGIQNASRAAYQERGY
jgi:hypothetical protein